MVHDQRDEEEGTGTNRASTSRRTFLAGTTGVLSVGALGTRAAAEEGSEAGDAGEGKTQERRAAAHRPPRVRGSLPREHGQCGEVRLS